MKWPRTARPRSPRFARTSGRSRRSRRCRAGRTEALRLVVGRWSARAGRRSQRGPCFGLVPAARSDLQIVLVGRAGVVGAAVLGFGAGDDDVSLGRGRDRARARVSPIARPRRSARARARPGRPPARGTRSSDPPRTPARTPPVTVARALCDWTCRTLRRGRRCRSPSPARRPAPQSQRQPPVPVHGSQGRLASRSVTPRRSPGWRPRRLRACGDAAPSWCRRRRCQRDGRRFAATSRLARGTAASRARRGPGGDGAERDRSRQESNAEPRLHRLPTRAPLRALLSHPHLRQRRPRLLGERELERHDRDGAILPGLRLFEHQAIEPPSVPGRKKTDPFVLGQLSRRRASRRARPAWRPAPGATTTGRARGPGCARRGRGSGRRSSRSTTRRARRRRSGRPAPG